MKNEKKGQSALELCSNSTLQHVSLPPEASGSDAFCHPKKTDLLLQQLRCLPTELREPTLPPCGGSWNFTDTRVAGVRLLKLGLSTSMQPVLAGFTGPLYFQV